ncbi:MAG: glutamate--tRNA ligase [Candidatus Lindowbacteria bacterium]|nr:glutamate--tRNA ligase [Candidatus Lindowbacteria bacterium]
MPNIRVRFAPSPTGHLHIGGARTALINWAFARQEGGTFILRIEDTDIERSTEESFGSILTSLKWLGLEWDEGVEKGGEYGPYRQSECFHLYQSDGERLLKSGDAYYCYCLPEELEERRKLALKEGRPPGYDRRCRSLSASQKDAFSRDGRRPVVRFLVPENQAIVVDDIVRGRVSFGPGIISDFIILRADGRPTFHFANVIDDLRMRITHVIRGEDHLSNTPRHVLLYRALGAEPPQFAHLSLIMGPDGARLSKRHGATSVEEFRANGYLPEGLLNCLALLGFSPPGGEEVFALEDFVRNFDLSTLGKSAAIFDRGKLDWINGTYIRKIPLDRLRELCIPYLTKAGYEISKYSEGAFTEIIESLRGNLSVLPDCVEEAAPYFKPIDALMATDAREFLKSSPAAQAVIAAFAEELRKRESLSAPDVPQIGKAVQKATGAKGKDLYMPIRIAISGRLHGPELAKMLPILGKQKCLERIDKTRAMIWGENSLQS